MSDDEDSFLIEEGSLTMIMRGENGEDKGSEDDVEQLEDEEDDPQGQAACFQLEGKN